MKKYDFRQPVIYTHIPKCAGTSVVQVLRQWFGRGYHKLNQDETQDILLPRVETRDERGHWLPDVKCIHGHFNHGRGYGLPYFYPEVTQYFTILRDPFDLAVSMYFFAKGRSARGEFWYRGQQVDFSSQFPSVSEYVKSYPYWLFNHLPQDLTLDNYETKLHQRFIYIGIFEDLQTSMSNLAKLLNKPEVEMPQLNASTYDEPVPHLLRERFYRDYPLLKRVYDFGLASYRDTQRVEDRAAHPQPGAALPASSSGQHSTGAA